MAETNVQSSDLAVGPAEGSSGFKMPLEVQTFAAKHGLRSYLAIAASLVERNFILKTPMLLTQVDDPESQTQWIEILANVSGDVAAVQAAHSDYTREWVRAVPLDKSPLIRLALALG